MKKVIIIALCVAGIYLANPANGIVRAQEGGECPHEKMKTDAVFKTASV